MALKVEVDSLDNIPSALHEHYKKGDDGIYRLDYEGAPDVSGLKSALEKERRNVKNLKKDLAAYDGLDVEQARALLSFGLTPEEIENIKKNGGIDEKKLEDMLESRVKAMKEEFANKETEYSSTVESLRGKLSKLMVDDVVLKEAMKAGVHESATEDIVRRARDIFKVVDDELKPMKGDEIIYGKDGISPLTVSDWVSELATNAPHLFKESSGGGAANEDGKGGTGTIKTKADLKTAADKAKFIGEHGQEAYLELPASAAQ